MHLPVHDYMTYKKQSTLGYFSQIKPKNFYLKDDNQVYNTMKSFYLVSKIFRSLKKDDKKPKSTTDTKFNFTSQKFSLLNPALLTQKNTQYKSTQSFLNTSAHNTITLSRKKSVCSSVQRTKTQIQDIKSRAYRIHSRLDSNKRQIKVVTNYNKLLDTYFDKIPSPTASVTKEDINEQEKFNKLCKQDIRIMMNKQKRSKKHKTIDEFRQPQIPQKIIQRLSEHNKQQLQEEKDRKEFKKHNKMRIKQKFLSYFPYGKQAQQIAQRSKSQGLINITNL